MKTTLRLLSFSRALAFLLLASACDRTLEPKPSPYPVPDPEEAKITLDCKSFHRFAEEDSVVVIVSAEEGASYDVSVSDNATGWVATSTLHGTQTARIGFLIGENKSGQDRVATLTFRYGANSSETVQISQEGKYRAACYEEWGLHGTIQGVKRNTRPYNWYIDQGKTGPFSSNNCGPSCVTMVGKWYNSFYPNDTEFARSKYRSSGGWWYMSDIRGFLDSQQIPYRYVTISGTDQLKKEIDAGNILLVCLDMHPLTYNSQATERVDKFYTTSPEWGHFIVLFGYIDTSEGLYFEACDPYSFSRTYLDGTLKGDGRFYRGDEIYRSASTWSSSIFIIEQP
jgi:hypothetical protein